MKNRQRRRVVTRLSHRCSEFSHASNRERSLINPDTDEDDKQLVSLYSSSLSMKHMSWSCRYAVPLSHLDYFLDYLSYNFRYNYHTVLIMCTRIHIFLIVCHTVSFSCSLVSGV